MTARLRLATVFVVLTAALFTAAIIAQVSPAETISGYDEVSNNERTLAALNPPKYAIHSYHATRRGTIVVRWGYQRYDSNGFPTGGFGYRHIRDKHASWNVPAIRHTISYGRLVGQHGQSYTRVARIGSSCYTTTMDRRTLSDGKMMGLITAYWFPTPCFRQTLPCSVGQQDRTSQLATKREFYC